MQCKFLAGISWEDCRDLPQTQQAQKKRTKSVCSILGPYPWFVDSPARKFGIDCHPCILAQKHLASGGLQGETSFGLPLTSSLPDIITYSREKETGRCGSEGLSCARATEIVINVDKAEETRRGCRIWGVEEVPLRRKLKVQQA